MKFTHIISELERNQEVFTILTNQLLKEEYIWKPQPDKWCILEIMCHLSDEEVEDFRSRLTRVLSSPDIPLPPINPLEWVESRKYMDQDFKKVCDKFHMARSHSLSWLKSLKNPDWNTTHIHPKVGPITAELFLVNWLEHDYLHIRQILNVKHYYLKYTTNVKLDYAGKW